MQTTADLDPHRQASRHALAQELALLKNLMERLDAGVPPASINKMTAMCRRWRCGGSDAKSGADGAVDALPNQVGVAAMPGILSIIWT
jgi:hypothetical protein